MNNTLRALFKLTAQNVTTNGENHNVNLTSLCMWRWRHRTVECNDLELLLYQSHLGVEWFLQLHQMLFLHRYQPVGVILVLHTAAAEDL